MISKLIAKRIVDKWYSQTISPSTPELLIAYISDAISAFEVENAVLREAIEAIHWSIQEDAGREVYDLATTALRSTAPSALLGRMKKLEKVRELTEQFCLFRWMYSEAQVSEYFDRFEEALAELDKEEG